MSWPSKLSHDNELPHANEMPSNNYKGNGREMPHDNEMITDNKMPHDNEMIIRAWLRGVSSLSPSLSASSVCPSLLTDGDNEEESANVHEGEATDADHDNGACSVG